MNKIARRPLMGVICGLTMALAASDAAALDPDASAPALNILFLGNSYTGTDSLPTRVSNLAVNAGWATPYIESVTPGGKQLWQHAAGDGSNAPTRIANGPGGSGDWDVVVLQEQSQLPAHSSGKNTFYSGALSLYDQVQANNPNAQVVLYETWARHTDYNFAGASYYIGANAQDMQDRLSTSYNYAADTYIPTNSTAADKTDVRVAEVGEAWRASYLDDADFRLHKTDNSHPASEGVYLTALMLYSEIYFTGVDGLSNAGLSSVSNTEATRLQGIAGDLIPDAYTRIAGDANDDGLVTQADIDFVTTNLGTTTPRLFNGDLNADGLVDSADLSIVQANVPEPSSLALLGLCSMAVLHRRRRS